VEAKLSSGIRLRAALPYVASLFRGAAASLKVAMLKDGGYRVGDDGVFAAAFVNRLAALVVVNTREDERQRVIINLPCYICGEGGVTVAVRE